MKAMGKLMAVLVITTVILGGLPFATAESDSLRVIMTSETGEYQVGDTIHVSIHVFEKGLPNDADTITVTLNTHWGQHVPLNLTAKHVSRGLYAVTYTVQEGDNYADFHAAVVVGNDADSTDLYLHIIRPDVEVSVLFDHSTSISASPGDTVVADVLVTYRGNPVDVDSFNPLQVIYGDGTYTNLTATRISTGHYNISVPVKNIKHSDTAVLQVDAHYVNDHSVGTATISIEPMGVWYHPIDLTGGTATFKLGVADSMGHAVSGADVYLDNNGHMDKTHYVTDSNGTVTVIVPHTYEGAQISGYVLNGSLNQSFSGMINTEPDHIPNPTASRFAVVPTTVINHYNVSEPITREYTAYNSSVPMQNKEIYYYVVAEKFSVSAGVAVPNTVVENGSVTTDDLGRFSLNIPPIQNQSIVEIYFEAPIPPNHYNYNPMNPNDHIDRDDNMVYEEDDDTIYLFGGNPWNSPDVQISVKNMNPGEPTAVSVSFPEMTETDQVSLSWMAFDDAENTAIRENGGFISQFYTVHGVPEWQPWTENANVIHLHSTDGGTFTGTAYIPAFMGENQNITFMASYTDVEGGVLYGNTLVVSPGKEASSAPGPSYILPLLLAIIVVALAAILLVMRKRDKKPQMLQYKAERETTAEEPPVQAEGAPSSGPEPQPEPQDYIPWQPQSEDGEPPVF